jgi:hypothetical protein
LPNKDLIKGGKRLIEVRSDWRYVVAPGSYVTPNGEGDGLYRVVNRVPPLLASENIFPWLKGEETREPPKPPNFQGKYLSLPCIKEIFRVQLNSHRRKFGAKLVAIACLKDGLSEEEVRKISEYYAEVQSQPNWPVNKNQVYAWWRCAKKPEHQYEWSCPEMIAIWKRDGRAPPCNFCPIRLEEIWRSSTS